MDERLEVREGISWCVIQLDPVREWPRCCSGCGERTRAIHDLQERRIRDLPLFEYRVVLHVPRALADLRDTNETTAVFEALAMSGIGFLVAAMAARADLPVAASESRAPAIRRAGSML